MFDGGKWIFFLNNNRMSCRKQDSFRAEIVSMCQNVELFFLLGEGPPKKTTKFWTYVQTVGK